MTLIQPVSMWMLMLWVTLRRHSGLFRAATFASFQVIPILSKSLLTVLLHFVRERPGPLLKTLEHPNTAIYFVLYERFEEFRMRTDGKETASTRWGRERREQIDTNTIGARCLSVAATVGYGDKWLSPWSLPARIQQQRRRTIDKSCSGDRPQEYTHDRPCRRWLVQLRCRGLQTAGCIRPPTHEIYAQQALSRNICLNSFASSAYKYKSDPALHGVKRLKARLLNLFLTAARDMPTPDNKKSVRMIIANIRKSPL